MIDVGNGERRRGGERGNLSGAMLCWGGNSRHLVIVLEEGHSDIPCPTEDFGGDGQRSVFAPPSIVIELMGLSIIGGVCRRNFSRAFHAFAVGFLNSVSNGVRQFSEHGLRPNAGLHADIGNDGDEIGGGFALGFCEGGSDDFRALANTTYVEKGRKARVVHDGDGGVNVLVVHSLAPSPLDGVGDDGRTTLTHPLREVGSSEERKDRVHDKADEEGRAHGLGSHLPRQEGCGRKIHDGRDGELERGDNVALIALMKRADDGDTAEERTSGYEPDHHPHPTKITARRTIAMCARGAARRMATTHEIVLRASLSLRGVIAPPLSGWESCR